ncbi:MAG: hypothetical protein JWQ43_2483 [Glaciihabitans sp.]|nr:hypothetical protein [Glaciihabitans sp.]
MRRGGAWYWSQPTAAALLLVYVAIGFALGVGPGANSRLESLQGSVNTHYFFPCLALSLLINHLVLNRRVTRVLFRTERVVLSVEFALAIALVLASFVAGALWLSVILWPTTIVVAVTALIVIITTNSSLHAARRRRLAATRERALSRHNDLDRAEGGSPD